MQNDISPLHWSWLNARGITNSTLEAFSIHTGDYVYPDSGVTALKDCIVIPVNNPDGTFAFNKYRRDPQDTSPGAKYLYDKGGRTTLYGRDHLCYEDNIVITEGELDTLVLHSLNITAVSSTGGAQSFQEDWADDITEYLQDIYLCFDNDDAGARGMVRTLNYLPDAKIIFIPEQPDVKDISDFVARGGDFHTLMESAFSPTDLPTVEADKRKRTSQWLPTRFHKAYIEEHTPPCAQAPSGFISNSGSFVDMTDDVQKAKAYPIPNLMEFKRNKALCPYHNEKTPSFNYYPKTNTCYCHGTCGKSADAIDIYMNIHNVSFKEALKELNKLV